MEINNTVTDVFDDFISAKIASGLSPKTIKTYKGQFKTIQNYIKLDIPIDELTKEALQKMILNMRKKDISPNTISSYVRTFKTFLSWCNDEGITTVKLKAYKGIETIKETYSDEELKKLLKKPDMRKCSFSDYRSWVIINLLVNNGIRSSTVRNIKNKDVDLENLVIYLRHTKNRKSQAIPLCTELSLILKSYLKIRGGNDDDFLFSAENGTQLQEHGLKSSIARYNKKRGVSKTGVHMFRHTFAKKYLVDCGGNAFTLQRLLGHSTLEMTKHYCAIFDSDIVKNYDKFSPLARIKADGQKLKMPKKK